MHVVLRPERPRLTLILPHVVVNPKQPALPLLPDRLSSMAV